MTESRFARLANDMREYAREADKTLLSLPADMSPVQRRIFMHEEHVRFLLWVVNKMLEELAKRDTDE